MTVGTRTGRQLKDTLDGLENALTLSKIGIWAEDTTEPSSGRRENTFCSSFEWDDLKQMLLLAYKGYYDTKREIVWFLTTLQEATTVEKNRPLTWEIEEIAKEFCKTHGLIPELVKCLNQVESIFSNIQSLVAEYDCFHVEDYEEEGHIVIRVDVRSDQDTAFREYDALNQWMIENISDGSLECFVLTVSRID
jgi:hypothetical protein